MTLPQILQIISTAETVTPGIVSALRGMFAQGLTIDQMLTQANAIDQQIESQADAEIAADKAK